MNVARKYLSNAAKESRRVGVVSTIQVLSCCNDGFHPGKNFAYGRETHREFSETVHILLDEFYDMAGTRVGLYKEVCVLVCNFLQVGLVMRFLSSKNEAWIKEHVTSEVTEEGVSFPQSEHFKLSNKNEQKSTKFFCISRKTVKKLAKKRVKDFASLVLPAAFELHLRTSVASNLLSDPNTLDTVFALQMPHPTAHMYEGNSVDKEDYHKAVLKNFIVEELRTRQLEILPRRTCAITNEQKANVRKKLELFVAHMKKLSDDDSTSAKFKLDDEQIKVVEKNVKEVLAGYSTLAVVEPCRTGKTRITLALVCLFLDVFLDRVCEQQREKAQVLFVSSVSASAFQSEVSGFCAAFAKIDGIQNLCKRSFENRTVFKTMTSLQTSSEQLVATTSYAIVVIDEVHETYSLSQGLTGISSYFQIASDLRGALKICVSGTPLVHGIRDVFFLGRLLGFDFSEWKNDENTFVSDCASHVDRLLMAGVADDPNARSALAMLERTFFTPCVARVQDPLRVNNKIVFEFDQSWFPAINDDGDGDDDIGDGDGKSFKAPYDSTTLFLDTKWKSNEYFLRAYCSRLYGAHPQLALNFLYQHLSDVEAKLSALGVPPLNIHNNDAGNDDDDENDDVDDDDDSDESDVDLNDDNEGDNNDNMINDDDNNDDANNEQIELLNNAHTKLLKLICDIQQAPTASLSDSYVAPAQMAYIVEAVCEHLTAERKVVITCEYLSALEKFRQILVHKIPALQTDSDSTVLFDAAHFASATRRTEVLAHFANPKSKLRVLFVSSSIGSAGVSFNVAHELIIMQVGWKASLEAQMSHRLSSRDSNDSNDDRRVTTLVTSLADFIRLINFLVYAEVAVLCKLGSVVCSDERFNTRLRVPWFLTRLNETKEQDCTAFLRAFFKTSFVAARAGSHIVKVTDKTPEGNTVRLEMSDDVVREMLNRTSLSALSTTSRPAKHFAGRSRSVRGNGNRASCFGANGGRAATRQAGQKKKDIDSTSLAIRLPRSHDGKAETKIKAVLDLLTGSTARQNDDAIIGAHMSFVDEALKPHLVEFSALPANTSGREVVGLYVDDIVGSRDYTCERTNDNTYDWYAQFVCAESHSFPNETIKKLFNEKKGTNRKCGPESAFLRPSMTDAALLLLCESTGYKLVSSFRSNMAFLSLQQDVKIFCTPAGVAFDPVSSQLFLLDVHVESMLVPDGALDSARESLLEKRTDLIYSLEIFGLERGILVDVGFDCTSSVPVRTMRLVYVTRDSTFTVFGEKEMRENERILTPAEYVRIWGRLGREKNEL